MSDRTRRTILERRAAFLAAAVASIGAASACDELSKARACLSATADPSARPLAPPADAAPAAPPDDGPPDEGPPMPCLSIAVPADAAPIACLGPMPLHDAGSGPPKPKPKACLSVLPDD